MGYADEYRKLKAFQSRVEALVHEVYSDESLRRELSPTYRVIRTPEMVLATGLHLPCRPLMGKVPGKPYVIDALNNVFMFYVQDGKLRYRFVYTLIRDF